MTESDPIRKFSGETLVIASHNAGKVREIAELLAPYVSSFPSVGDLGLPEPEETGDTYLENASLKALAAARGSGHPALADDSGLSVRALNGAPGVHTAPYAERADGTRDFYYGMEKLKGDLGDAEDRGATFNCCLVLAWPDGHTEAVQGQVAGRLDWPPRGEQGFGFDPIFIPEGHSITFGEMDPAAKHAMSHRAVAFRHLIARCFA